MSHHVISYNLKQRKYDRIKELKMEHKLINIQWFVILSSWTFILLAIEWFVDDSCRVQQQERVDVDVDVNGVINNKKKKEFYVFP